MDKMIQAVIGIAVFFILLTAIVLPNFQDARNATNDNDVDILIYLVMLLFLIAVGLGYYKKMQ